MQKATDVASPVNVMRMRNKITTTFFFFNKKKKKKKRKKKGEKERRGGGGFFHSFPLYLGGGGGKGKTLYNRLADMIASKETETESPLPSYKGWLRCRAEAIICIHSLLNRVHSRKPLVSA